MVSQRLGLSRPRGWPRWVRYAVSALAVVALLTATAVIGYRVLAPSDTPMPATQPYPDKPQAEAVRYARLTSAPLIVDGRLRVFADARRVWADQPLTAHTEQTPYWSYRRWPAEVAGVVAFEAPVAGQPVIVVKYSDGMIVTLDAPTGRVLWQDRVRTSDRDRYTGRRTGALTVYQPAGLFSVRSSADGGPVLIVAGADQVRAYNPWTGQRYWEHVFTEHPGCHDIDWTGETTYVAKDACAAPAVLEIFDAGTGRPLGKWKPPGASAGPAKEANWYVEPISCLRGHSACRLFRAAAIPDVISGAKLVNGVVGVPAQVWRLNHDGTVSAERHAVADRPFALGESLIEENAGNGYVRAVERATGKVIWISTEPARLVAVNHTGVYAITRDYWLVVLNPATGVELSRTHLRDRDDQIWLPGQVHVAGRFVVVERINGTGPNVTDEQYFFTSTPVMLVGV